VTAEKAIHQSFNTIVETFGYAAGSEVPVFTKAYATVGTHVPGNTLPQEGQVAAVLRWSTTARSTRNHPIYLYNYYHGVNTDAAGDPSYLRAATRTAIGTYANAWIAGFSDGTHTLVRTGPNGHNANGQLVEQFLSHRDFPRD
jgi:hypothetical protein